MQFSCTGHAALLGLLIQFCCWTTKSQTLSQQPGLKAFPSSSKIIRMFLRHPFRRACCWLMVVLSWSSVCIAVWANLFDKMQTLHHDAIYMKSTKIVAVFIAVKPVSHWQHARQSCSKMPRNTIPYKPALLLIATSEERQNKWFLLMSFHPLANLKVAVGCKASEQPV